MPERKHSAGSGVRSGAGPNADVGMGAAVGTSPNPAASASPGPGMGAPAPAADRLKQLSTLVAVVTVVLLLVFYVFTIRNTLEVKDQVNAIEKGPYMVSFEAGRIETYLVQLRTLAERPLFARTEAAIDDVEKSYFEVDEAMQKSVTFVESHHPDRETGEALAQGFGDLRALQRDYIALCRSMDATDEEVSLFVEEKLKPLIDDLLRMDAEIFEAALAGVDALGDKAKSLGFQNILLTSILMAAVVSALALYLVLIHRQHRQEEALREELRHALAMAQDASKAKSDFLSSMSHDIRTPMNAIVGLTAIAGSHLDDPARVRECLDRIEVSSNHLMSLINDVLDMGKIESGKIVLSCESFRLPLLVDGVIAIVQPQLKAKKLAFDFDMEGVEHGNVFGDPTRLEQVLLNLMSNAVKYTPEGGSVRLVVSEEPWAGADGGGSYRFVVSDTGVGMSEDFLRIIFEPFERAHNGTTERIEGAGLGMAITKSIVDMMGGTIEVESALGQGSTFTVVVPLRSVDGARGADGQCSDERLPVAGSQCSDERSIDGKARSKELLSGRVLVVEDNDLNLEIATELIEATGARVEQAHDGMEAVYMLTAASDGYYDLVLMDIQMPRMNGVQATIASRRALAEEGRPCPAIVAVTANAFSDDRDLALAAGMSDFLTKPISIKELDATLRKYLPGASLFMEQRGSA